MLWWKRTCADSQLKKALALRRGRQVAIRSKTESEKREGAVNGLDTSGRSKAVSI